MKHLFLGLLLSAGLAIPLQAGICELKKVDLKNSTEGLELVLHFNTGGEHLVYDATVKSQEEFFLLTYSVPECENKARKLPVMEYPILHSEVLAPKDTKDNNLHVNFYLKNKPPLSHADNQGVVTTKMKVSEVFPDEAPVILDVFSAVSEASNTVTMRFEFNEMPKIKQAFMTENGRSAVFIFGNTALAGTMSKPNVAFIKEFKVEDGITFAGVPYTKLIIGSEDQMFYTDSPEANVYVVELFGQGVEEDPGMQAPQQATSYTPREGTNTVDVAAYERKQSSYAAASTVKNVLLWGGGLALLGVGGYYAWDALKPTEKPYNPDTFVTTIPGPIEGEVFPADP